MPGFSRSLSRGPVIIGILLGGILALALPLFYLLPDFGAWIRGEAQPLVGFTDSVALGDIASLTMSNRFLFDVEFHDFASLKSPLTPSEVTDRIPGMSLYRGAVLEQYDNGIWTIGRERVLVRGFPVAPPERRRLLVQTVRLEPIDTKVLFTVGFPVGAIDNHPVEDERTAEIYLDKRSFEIHRRSGVSREVLTYRAYSLVDAPSLRLMTPNAKTLHDAYLATLLRMPDALAPLGDFAAETVGTRHPDPMKQRDAVVAIERRFRNSNDFLYSMQRAANDPKLDPLIDFVLNHKSGTCEHYASAMTIMLRSLSIPARLITGFKGGEYNDKSKRYEIRGRHAHAWVEAYVDDAWKAFDPTPGKRQAEP